MAGQHISPEKTVMGFNKCCISSTVDKTDDMSWNGSEEDRNVRECEEDKDTDCEYGQSYTDW